jgi:type II secretory pathway component PulJ
MLDKSILATLKTADLRKRMRRFSGFTLLEMLIGIFMLAWTVFVLVVVVHYVRKFW